MQAPVVPSVGSLPHPPAIPVVSTTADSLSIVKQMMQVRTLGTLAVGT